MHTILYIRPFNHTFSKLNCTFLFIHSFIHSFIHPFIHPFIHSSFHPSFHPFIDQSIHPSINQSIHPSIYLPTHFFSTMTSKLYGVNATIVIFVFVLYCIVLYCIVYYQPIHSSIHHSLAIHPLTPPLIHSFFSIVRVWNICGGGDGTAIYHATRTMRYRHK